MAEGMTVGERIKYRRKQLGLTQEELAKRLGIISKASVCSIENRKTAPKAETVLQYADALETTAAWLYGWDDDTPPEMRVDGDPYTEEERKIIEAYRVKSFIEQKAFKTLLGISEDDDA